MLCKGVIRVLALIGASIFVLNSSNAMSQEIKKVVTVEGITQYELENGMVVLLFPDDSRPTVTVSLTVFVGSRHEGYGEAGMAHLLEHMLFKGTPTHQHIPKLLQDRGARFNGTTSVDRTNYYETLPAKDDNLEFAIKLESDRMINSFIKGEDLASEMTVVRNEFERGENSPRRILMQRIESAAFDWHNYGQSTIGNRSDIERVPLPNLRRFYEKYYQPDNAMLVVAGKFAEKKALGLIQEHFGAIPRPTRQLDRTYTTEPAQDGERTVTLRRVGDVALAGAAYHVPSGGHPEFASVSVMSYLLAMEPGGRLYKAMVETKKTASVYGFAAPNHDPSLLMMFTEVAEPERLGDAGKLLLETIEGLAGTEITEEEVERAKRQILKGWELRLAKTDQVAVSLSNWSSQGDWRLFFLYRDRIEKVTVDDVKEVAAKYLVRNNRTFGEFIPSKKAQRIEVPATPDLAAVLADYKGRKTVAAGEQFDASPHNIEARTERGAFASGFKFAFLPKKTRGESVTLRLTLRYGTAENLKSLRGAAALLPSLMTRGTKQLSHQQIRDELDKNKATLQAGGQRGYVTVSIQTKRDNLPDVIGILEQVLREPLLAKEELEVLRRERLASLEQVLSDPRQLASNQLRQILSPYPKDDIRHVPPLSGQVDMFRNATHEQIVRLHREFLGGENGQVTVVGDFRAEQTKALLADALSSWVPKKEYERIDDRVFPGIPGQHKVLNTPDKANAAYYAGLVFPLKDTDKDYPSLLIGNFVLGGGSLASRLGDRVRQKEGLSYGVGSRVQAGSFDAVGGLTVVAISNPDNTPKLIDVINEELTKLVDKGVSEKELADAKRGYLQRENVGRASDASLVGILNSTLYTGRTMNHYADLESRIASLRVEDVNRALKEYVQLKRLVVVTAGDFEKDKQPE